MKVFESKNLSRDLTEPSAFGLDYIPPKSIGTLIGQFVRECELKSKGAADAFEDISSKFSVVSEFDADYAELSDQIETINKKLEGMLNVGELQKKYKWRVLWRKGEKNPGRGVKKNLKPYVYKHTKHVKVRCGTFCRTVRRVNVRSEVKH